MESTSKIIYVMFKRLNVRNYLVKEDTALFEVFVEDNYGKNIFRGRFSINKALSSIINLVLKEEELKHYKIGEGVNVIIQDKELVKEAIKNLINKIKELRDKLNSKDPSAYLDTLSRINRLSLDFDKELEELKKENSEKPLDWKERLRITRLKKKD